MSKSIINLPIAFFICLLSLTVGAQNTVSYQSDNTIFANPERGFYHHTETHSNNYNSLNTNTLSNYRTNESITLILRVFYLEDFKSSSINSTYLSNIGQDLAAVRAAGLKCILRFAYNNDQTATDAPKAIMLQHLDQLQPIFEEYEDVIALAQAGFIGSWGEWFYTTQAEFGIPGSTPNYANRGEVLTKFLDVLPESRMVQVRTPTFKRNIFSTNSSIESAQAFTGTDLTRTGHHNDCFLASSTDFGTYGNVTTDKNYLSEECLYVVNGGETCASSNFSGCVNALSDLSNLRYSYLNTDYNRVVLDVWESDGCMEDVKRSLGYRFELLSGEYPETVSTGSTFNINIELSNQGWAGLYNPRSVELILRSKSTPSNVFVYLLSEDPRFWLPGETSVLNNDITLSNDIPSDEYDLYLNLPDMSSTLKDNPEYSVRLANANTWEASTGYNDLQTSITVSNVTGLENENQKLQTIYPNPTKGEVLLSVESEYEVSNFLGELLIKGLGAKIDLSNLSDGVYIISTSSKKFLVTKE